jgi:hypothetical protein
VPLVEQELLSLPEHLSPPPMSHFICFSSSKYHRIQLCCTHSIQRILIHTTLFHQIQQHRLFCFEISVYHPDKYYHTQKCWYNICLDSEVKTWIFIANFACRRQHVSVCCCSHMFHQTIMGFFPPTIWVSIYSEVSLFRAFFLISKYLFQS